MEMVRHVSDDTLDFTIINQLDSTKPIAFQLTDRTIPNEVMELLLTHRALRSPIESNKEEIISLLRDSNSFSFSSENEIPSNDYIEWSLTSDNLIRKRKHFRKQISLYNNYDIRHPSITMQIVEIIQYYIKEYLFREENFANDYINLLEEYFQHAIRQQDYFLYFIKAYTMTGNFHCVLNKHLALYIIDYFDPSSYIFQPGNYRLINCLAHITAFSFNYPHINKYQYKGITYRGLIINEDDLECYTIGNYILNRSVATLFSGFEQEYNSTKRTCILFKYKIETKTTSLDIERISSIKDEREVIILPFSVFQVKHRKEIYSNEYSHTLHEVHLEECLDDQLSTNHQQSKSKRQAIFIGLCVIISLFALVGFIIHSKMKGKVSPARNQTTVYSHRLGSNLKWKQHGTTVAGGNGPGKGLNQLNSPKRVYFDDKEQSIYIADYFNDRIVKWKLGEHNGEIVAGGTSKGNRTDQLNSPSDMFVDHNHQSLIICDRGNERVVRWPFEAQQDKQIIVENIGCYGLIMNEKEDLFVSDSTKHSVRRWRKGEQGEGTIVAGGNGYGDQLNQLKSPTSIFVDRHETVYVSDYHNHRVMKWMKDAKKGIIAVGGWNRGSSLNQLSYPNGLIVNEAGDIYVTDSLNNRVMYWAAGSKEGRVIVGGNGRGNKFNQFYYPTDLSFDSENNLYLYVTDSRNHRIQRFDVEKN